jgi:hypothetical protein|nr:hypothetical protein Q903MT_gene2415 [Picea sitchensis]
MLDVGHKVGTLALSGRAYVGTPMLGTYAFIKIPVGDRNPVTESPGTDQDRELIMAEEAEEATETEQA